MRCLTYVEVIMVWWLPVVLSALLSASCTAEDLTFPPGFKFGAATAAYQIEGGWNASDKSENIWDRFAHEDPTRIKDRSNGDVACDSYRHWKRDIEMAEELGLHYYRFSLSWSRLLPNGFANYISEDGKNYYNNLINGLLEKGIEPFVTLYHWDMPQTLQDLGGSTNPLIADWFGDYARVVYSLYGDRVKMWLTINEPLIICDAAYSSGFLAPGITSPEVGVHLCSKNLLMAHAKAWRIYDEEFKPKYQGRVSIANHLLWVEPLNPEDLEQVELAELAVQNCAGRFSHPIYSKEGGWPPSIEKVMKDLSFKRGYPKTVLPEFTPEEIQFVKGTYDFYAMNHYTSRLIRKAKEGEEFRPWPLGDAEDLDGILEKGKNWTTAASFWFFNYPEGIRRQLAWLKKNYGDLEYLLTENGFSTFEGQEDLTRIEYYKDYLKQVLLAIKEDGVNITHYTAWSLMDNYEWMDGYRTKFGLYEVNFTDPLRRRTPRDSARYYASVIKRHSLDESVVREEL